MDSEDTKSGGMAQLAFVVRALRHRNYRLFFFGQGVSLIGTWMQGMALGWLVYRLTGSEVLLGVVAFSTQILTFLTAPFAGVIADRVNRRKILVVTQTAAMMQAFLLAALTLSGVVTVWHIIVLGMVMGLIAGFDIPIRQSFVVEMIESREDLSNAIALNSSLVNGARLVGPSLAGIVVAVAGEGICFLLNGVSFLAVLAALLAMRIKPAGARGRDTRMLHHLKEGFDYAFGSAPIRALLLLVAIVSLFGMSYGVLLPVFAKAVLHGGPRTQGFLMAATGVGALCGAVFLASRKDVRGLARVMTGASVLFGVALIGFSVSRSVWLSLGMLVLAGLGMMIQMAGNNTLLQMIVDDDKRGRVMSFYTMAFMGMGPFGSLLAGGLAGTVGAPTTVAVCGLCCVLAAGVFVTKLPIVERSVRAIGFVPEQVLVQNGGPVPVIGAAVRPAAELGDDGSSGSSPVG